MDKIKREEVIKIIYKVSHEICDIDLKISELVEKKVLLQTKIRCLKHKML